MALIKCPAYSKDVSDQADADATEMDSYLK